MYFNHIVVVVVYLYDEGCFGLTKIRFYGVISLASFVIFLIQVDSQFELMTYLFSHLLSIIKL